MVVVFGLGLKASGKETLDSLNDRNCELFGREITGGSPVAVSPFDFDGAERSDDGGSSEVLVPVEDDG